MPEYGLAVDATGIISFSVNPKYITRIRLITLNEYKDCVTKTSCV
jgi:hypothetical protein